MQDLCTGQVVISTAGRDKAQKFVVLCIIDDQYVYICDGDTRRLEKPKKKKIKHLKKLNRVIEEINDKSRSEGRLSNSKVRKLLNSID